MNPETPGRGAGRTDGVVPAMGGTRLVPAPDPIATAFILLALRLDQRRPGLVGGYVGPAALKAQVDMEQWRSPGRLRDDAMAARALVAADVPEPDRRAWLDDQIVALAAHAEALTDAPPVPEAFIAGVLGFMPQRPPDVTFTDARAAIEAILPGPDPLPERLAAWDRRLALPPDGLRAALGWLVERYRARADELFGSPEAEGLRLAVLDGRPGATYAWYDGGRHSRIDVGGGEPIDAPEAIRRIAAATYPGRHFELAWKEAELVDRLGRSEASVVIVDTPAAAVSAGMGAVAPGFAVAPGAAVDHLLELVERAGLPLAEDRAEARAIAEQAIAMEAPRARLRSIDGAAALLRHVDGRPPAEVLDFLRDVGGDSVADAERRLAAIEEPRRWVGTVVEMAGEALVRRWIDAVPGDGIGRFGRLLREQLTPSTMRVTSQDPV